MANQLLVRLTSLEKTVAELAEVTRSALTRAEAARAKALPLPDVDVRPDRNIAVLEELDKRGTMTMKELSEFLGVSVQTAWISAHECIKYTDRCFLMTEPHLKNKRLRLVSMRMAPELASLLKRVGDN